MKIDLSDISILVNATLHTLSDCTQPAANWVLQLIHACGELQAVMKILVRELAVALLTNCIRSCFSTSNEIVTAFSIFEPKRVPKLGTTELESYGKDSIKHLLSHYGESKTATTLKTMSNNLKM